MREMTVRRASQHLATDFTKFVRAIAKRYDFRGANERAKKEMQIFRSSYPTFLSLPFRSSYPIPLDTPLNP